MKKYFTWEFIRAFVAVTYWRLICQFKDHDMMAVTAWHPDAICMRFTCARCGKMLGHLDVPTKVSPTKKRSLH